MSSGPPDRPPPGLSNEARLLLACFRALWDVESASQVHALAASGTDWDYVTEGALWHGIVPVVYRSLSRVGPGTVPEPVLERLRSYHVATVARNMLLSRELKELLRLFGSQGIPSIPLKGPALAEALYGDCALRHSHDLDLLVRRQDLAAARSLLLSRGYEPREKLTPRQEARFLRRDCEYHFFSERTQIPVELHWRILPQQHFDSDFLWERALPDAAGAPGALGLPAEEMFVLLCVHGGSKHQWALLKWIGDAALLIVSHPGLDWDHVMGLARSLGEERSVRGALCVVQRLLDVPLPDGVAPGGREGRLHAGLVGLVRGRLFRNDRGLPGFSEWRRYLREPGPHGINDEPTATIVGELLLYLRLVMTPEFHDRNTLPLPRSLSFLHWIYRPGRLFRQNRWKLLRRLP